ncbi:hypothetical protein A6J84_009670 [Streptococcus sp. FDAARGOS_256]|nr:hypothetical protein CYK17_09570 [Streptococcus oralis subsp. dentisani]PNK72512.1 hypothetical protein A6J84_009670 [Streptococcus sp. FDAARGOS_256]RKV79375.1 MAG: hypothetical protein D8H99_49675 [Streptococcus sp.]
MSCCNFDKFSISSFINFFHPNLELSSKHLELLKEHNLPNQLIRRDWDKKILILGILYYKFLKSID